MSSSSSEDISSDNDSDLDILATEACNKMKKLLGKSNNTGKKKQMTLTRDRKMKCDTLNESEKTKSSQNLFDFVIDKTPLRYENDEVTKTSQLSTETDDKTEESPSLDSNKAKKKVGNLSSSLQTKIQISDNYFQTTSDNKSKKKTRSNVADLDEVMKKSVITPDFEKQFSLTPYEESVRQQKKQRRKEREKTKGKNWYNMEAPEMTEEKKNDLMVVHMRKALDPKRFYKNNDTVSIPKYFQLGTVVESSADFYHSRVPKKQRKSNMVEELLADAEFRKYNKRKYVEIQEQKRKAQGPYKHMKRLKKNKR
ncbi:rRNA-processing protein fcf2,Deoxynucleotidyltransferase terminal-interacting protein 2 [Mytilus coruscus]|uniref:rRNA-processing protein fcf2,Deoxynucleotidyltransferase terminal-interacting protein 2 n=1 Tax=Mytilus coruscus TaxID=42192 RepID=A0A6J8C905_MYTCO|nr:rRNA-processing protein fcf2,Deoxynucleotidyltransferase terminal-interacting protein 2 [Mytilus coruscus]